MPSPAEILGTPPLRKKWQDAKTAAETAAKKFDKEKEKEKIKDKDKEVTKLADVQKLMKGSFGPALESWPKKYPDWPGLQTGKTTLDETIKTYTSAVTSSKLADTVKKPMITALTEIKTAMGLRLTKAKELVESDFKLGVKQNLKAITPIILFQQDVARPVAEAAGKTKLKPTKIELEVILSDDRVIKHVPSDLDDGVLAKEIREAANYHLIIEQLGKLLVSVQNLELHAAEDKFETGMDKIIETALERAAVPILKLVKVRSEYKMYKIKKGATLTIAVTGVIVSTVALATTPFTGGASTVLGIIGIMKSLNTIRDEVNRLAQSAETFVKTVTNEISTLYKQYVTASTTVVGTGETAKSLVNSVVGPFFTTIKDTKTHCEQVQDKINGLEVQTHDCAQKLGQLLTEQATFQKELSNWEKVNKPKLSPKDIEVIHKLSTLFEKTAEPVSTMINKIEVLHKRVETNKGSFIMLERAISQLAAKEPTWAKVAEILIPVITSVGFLVGGNVHVPEPSELLKVTHTVFENFGRVSESMNAAKELAENVKDMAKRK